MQSAPFSMLIIAAPRIFVKGAVFFARATAAFWLCRSKNLCFRQKCVTLNLPLKSGKVLTQTQAAAPYRYLSTGQGRFSLEVSRSPGRLRAERGDLTMTFEEVAILLTLLGGAIYVTFQITWTVSHGDDKRKKK